MRSAILPMLGLLGACSTTPEIDVHTNILCAQPPSAALSPAARLPAIPALPGSNPSEVVGVLAQGLVEDGEVYGGEVDKREALIKHGVEQCGWTR